MNLVGILISAHTMTVIYHYGNLGIVCSTIYEYACACACTVILCGGHTLHWLETREGEKERGGVREKEGKMAMVLHPKPMLHACNE